jgi:hypothetical protein
MQNRNAVFKCARWSEMCQRGPRVLRPSECLRNQDEQGNRAGAHVAFQLGGQGLQPLEDHLNLVVGQGIYQVFLSALGLSESTGPAKQAAVAYGR